MKPRQEDIDQEYTGKLTPGDITLVELARKSPGSFKELRQRFDLDKMLADGDEKGVAQLIRDWMKINSSGW